MTSFPALDVAIGMSFAYFLFSVLATAGTEAVSRFTHKRARDLEGWLKHMLADPAGGSTAYASFLASPTMQSLLISTRRITKPLAAPTEGATAKASRHPRPPAYIPSPHFVNAVLSIGRGAGEGAAVGLSGWDALGADLQRQPIAGTVAGQALLEIYRRASGDAVQFRRDAEAWFDDQMERLSGVYKRWSQWVVWAIGISLALALNANSFRMAETLWNDPSSRQSIVTAAGSATAGETVAKAQSDINALPLPLGWNGNGYHHLWGWAIAFLGALITFAAISLGAPFWFDTLSRLSRLRSTGAPPPSSDSTRRGEGEQSRSLPPVAEWKPDLHSTAAVPAEQPPAPA
jgi:hypothetical protein